LHPAADHGVHRVAAPPCHLPVHGRELSPRCPTLQSLPLPSSRNRVTAAPMPPRCHQVRTWTSHEALLHSRIRCAANRCRKAAPVALLGFPHLKHLHIVVSRTRCPPKRKRGGGLRAAEAVRCPPRAETARFHTAQCGAYLNPSQSQGARRSVRAARGLSERVVRDHAPLTEPTQRAPPTSSAARSGRRLAGAIFDLPRGEDRSARHRSADVAAHPTVPNRRCLRREHRRETRRALPQPKPRLHSRSRPPS
jgi:hypothetical protein